LGFDRPNNIPNSNLIKPFGVLRHCNTGHPPRKSHSGISGFYIPKFLYRRLLHRIAPIPPKHTVNGGSGYADTAI